MKTTARKALGIALSVLLMMSVLASNALTTFVSATTYSGVCGEHLNWAFDTVTKILSITGTGAMYTYSDYSLTPWYKYAENIQTVEIANGVTSVTDEAFSSEYSDYENLTSLILGNTLTTIGEGAFDYCQTLTSLVMPNSVTSVGAGAFNRCSGLTTATLSANLLSIENYLFSGCSSLASIVIPNKVKSIGQEAFFACESMTSVTIGSSVASIGNYAFYYCHSITNLIIPNAVTSIGSGAFDGCSALQSIILPDTLSILGSHAFQYCSALSNIVIPKGLTSIEGYTFHSCSQLTNVTIPNSIVKIDYGAFRECSQLTSVIVPASVKEFGDGVFADCDLVKVWCIRNSAAHTYAINNGLMFDFLVLVSSVALDASSCTLNSGANNQLTATVLPANAYDKSVSWKSSNTTVATVSSTGLVTAKAAGQATVTCTTQDGSGKLATCAVTVKPAAPTNLKAASASYNSIKISWNAVSGVSGYAVYRYNSSTKKYERIKTTTSTTYTNTSLTTGTTYSYKVLAYKTVDGTNIYSAASATATAKPVPATPTNFKAVRYSSTSIKLTWSAVAGASGYVIYKYNTSTKTWVKLKALPASSTSYINTGLAKGVTYYYKIRAYRTVSGTNIYGAPSAQVSAKTS